MAPPAHADQPGELPSGVIVFNYLWWADYRDAIWTHKFQSWLSQ